jgi:hypothetical protein
MLTSYVSAEQEAPKIVPDMTVDDATIARHKGDIDGLFDEWIRPKLQIMPGILGLDGIPTNDEGITEAKEIESGIKRFCLLSDGKFNTEKVGWGWIFTCKDREEKLVGIIRMQADYTDFFRPHFDSPARRQRSEQRREKRRNELNALSKENGATGWITFNQERVPILRFGTLTERMPHFVNLFKGGRIPFEDLRYLNFYAQCCDVEIETKDGKKNVVNTADLVKEIEPFYYMGLSGLQVVLMSDDGTPYEIELSNRTEGIKIEIDPNYVPVAITPGQIPEQVLLNGRNKLRPILEKRRQQEIMQQKELERLAKAEEQHFAKFRNSLKLGNDTHCGPIIEIRGPMIKIAIIAQLRGYPSEAWLKRNQVFPPSYGCVNINGQLSIQRRN